MGGVGDGSGMLDTENRAHLVFLGGHLKPVQSLSLHVCLLLPPIFRTLLYYHGCLFFFRHVSVCPGTLGSQHEAYGACLSLLFDSVFFFLFLPLLSSFPNSLPKPFSFYATFTH